ncbi:MAG: hypothetical protein HGB02_03690 [Chlorobiaceae bacterium]|nr:hypothetical protein [Chlorobiaceae bacterium]
MDIKLKIASGEHKVGDIVSVSEKHGALMVSLGCAEKAQKPKTKAKLKTQTKELP